MEYDKVYMERGNIGSRHECAEGAFFETCTRFLLLFTFAKVVNTTSQKDKYSTGNINVSGNL